MHKAIAADRLLSLNRYARPRYGECSFPFAESITIGDRKRRAPLFDEVKERHPQFPEAGIAEQQLQCEGERQSAGKAIMKNKATHISEVPPDKGHYIAGFVDGAGSFYISARVRQDYPTRWKFGLHFNISNRDKVVLEICKKYIGCGTIRESEKEKGFYVLEVQDRKKLREFVIPFFSKFGFLSNKKRSEFRVFQEGLVLLDNGIRTEVELNAFLRLREKLNQLRKTNISNTDAIILESFVFMRESSET